VRGRVGLCVVDHVDMGTHVHMYPKIKVGLWNFRKAVGLQVARKDCREHALIMRLLALHRVENVVGSAQDNVPTFYRPRASS